MGEDKNAPSGRTPTVFVADPSAEAERIADTLRTAGYSVIDVALSMLVSRTQAQRPNVILVDVDASGALDEIARVRRLPGSGAVDFVYFGTGEGAVRNADDAMVKDGSAFFLRPVDIAGLVRKVEALTGGPLARPEMRPSTPPPSMPARTLQPITIPPERPSAPSLPAPGLRTPGPPLPMSTPSLVDLVDPPRSLATFGTVSNELQQLLHEAELRAEVLSTPEALLASPEEEIESVLPADVLASLDEPIGGDEDEESQEKDRPGTGPGEPTGAHGKGTTSGGKHTTASGRSATSQTHDRRSPSDAPKTSDHHDPMRARTADTPADVKSTMRRARSESSPPSSVEPPKIAVPLPANEDGPMTEAFPRPAVEIRGASTAPPALVLGSSDARRVLAEAIARRSSGALCYEHERVVRRIVVRDGDLVTAASGAERESLVYFLGARGELPRDEIERLAEKVPPFGRHAGAALVAHGWLGQDQLWTVLRAHAEWIATAVLRLPGGTAQLEPDPPGRLRAEPSVFAAATGAEIFVELVRRAIAPEEAVQAMGGESSRIGDGPNANLFAECALAGQDLELLARCRGGTIADLLARAPDPEIVSVVHALALLGVLDVIPPVAPSRSRSEAVISSSQDVEVAALDEEAIRARIRARLELVDEGDYFSVLGVSRDATSYEVRRAFIELRRAFEPARILTPRLVDLAPDVRKIVVVLEEAYEILRDGARRERYRRAIEARPE